MREPKKEEFTSTKREEIECTCPFCQAHSPKFEYGDIVTVRATKPLEELSPDTIRMLAFYGGITGIITDYNHCSYNEEVWEEGNSYDVSFYKWWGTKTDTLMYIPECILDYADKKDEEDCLEDLSYCED